ncbi:DUF6446 family protein [Rhodobacter ferrooxidans]|uniref:Uncharacterized protein n=1 Tax=Rhodobacter ferrooxidans TaxID=371731 RepID=C8S0D3_9RHOB|nr:DUF6446 family protein [Rhodobacter sp. SW2]EEW25467.1 hypothetical protein Rsw2DRAFT_1511 [Rhodobacter sp. SW2]
MIGLLSLGWRLAAAVPVAFFPGAEIRLTPIIGAAPEVILANDITETGTEAPLQFRACFTTPMSQALLTETYRVYDAATPPAADLDCFDTGNIAAALHTGEAIAFLSEPGIAPGIDRVVAVYADGRAYAWHQPTASRE